MIGKELSIIPVMISLVKILQKEGTSVPYGTILTTLIITYLFCASNWSYSDFIPGVGYVDDMAVVSFVVYGKKT